MIYLLCKIRLRMQAKIVTVINKIYGFMHEVSKYQEHFRFDYTTSDTGTTLWKGEIL